MLISVIIPMYNSKDTILLSIESVLKQTYQGDIEILVINDGSSDGCETLVEDYISDNKSSIPIKLINKKNGGVSSARNLGIQESRGEWIALLDSDDIWLPEKLEKQVNTIKKNKEIKFIGTVINNEYYPYFKKSNNKLYTLNAKEIITKWYPQTSTALIHKDVFIKSGLYDKLITHAEDGELWLRIVLFYELFVLNENLVNRGTQKRSFGDCGLSSNLFTMHQGEIYIIKNAKKRKQINLLYFLFFYCWLSVKYIRRRIIVMMG